MKYDYVCSECENIFEFEQSYKDKPKTKCPDCKTKTLSKILSVPHIWVKSYDNVGTYTERQEKRLGKDGVQERHAKEEERIIERNRIAKEKLKLRAPKGSIIE